MAVLGDDAVCTSYANNAEESLSMELEPEDINHSHYEHCTE